MIDIVAKVLSELGGKLIEVGVEAIFTPDSSPPPPTSDPLSEAQATINGFLTALAARDWDALGTWCDPDWVENPDNAAVIDNTLEAAPPLSWAFRESYVPDTWFPGTHLPWVLAELLVTFDLGDGQYATVPGVFQASQSLNGWLVSYLEWQSTESDVSEPAEPEEDVLNPYPFSDPFSSIFDSFQALGPAVLVCAGCGQKLSVPSDQGRLRVTCPKCRNVQWFEP